MTFSIGQIGRATGTNVQTIRYYEKRGLLPEPSRSASGQRQYEEEHQRRLAFIRHARNLGFSLGQITDLLELADHPDQSCARADQIAEENLQKVRQHMAALQDLEQELLQMLSCKHEANARKCKVIEVLADHQMCLHAEHKPVEKSSVG